MSHEAWLGGPVEGVPPLLMPAAHALVQARNDVADLAPAVSIEQLWRQGGAAAAGFHLLHLTGSLDRLYTYARGERLNEDQKTALKAEAVAHLDLDGRALADRVAVTVERALHQLRHTDPATLLEPRVVGRAQLPSNVLGLLFHGAEHTTRHVGQFITTIKLLSS